MTSKKRIAIIGAGVGGLTAAAILARSFDVRVYERAPQAGGKIRQVAIGDGAIDSGPTVFTMAWVFDEVFAAAGTTLNDHLSLNKLDVLARHAWRDGGRLDLYADEIRTAEAITEFSGRTDAENYLAFCAKTKRIFETLRDPFLCATQPSFASLMMRSNPIALLGTKPFSTMWSELMASFKDPRLAQLFGRYATYCGSSPFEAPATLMLIAHVEQEGVWFLDGGMQAIATALERVAKKNGAEFTYNAHVAEITAGANSVSGITLSNGEHIDADIVLYNGDTGAIDNGAMGASARRAISLPADRRRSQSAITWSASATVTDFDLSAHNVFFSDDYRSEFDSVFKQDGLPAIPTTYVFAPDRVSNHAIHGAPERLFILVNAPPIGDRHDYTQQEIDACQTRMIDHLNHCGVTVRINENASTVTTPTDFANMFPGTGGALFGAACHSWRASFQRPTVRAKIPGLYLAGGSVHPGPGVPMAALSGKAAAAAILSDSGVK